MPCELNPIVFLSCLVSLPSLVLLHDPRWTSSKITFSFTHRLGVRYIAIFNSVSELGVSTASMTGEWQVRQRDLGRSVNHAAEILFDGQDLSAYFGHHCCREVLLRTDGHHSQVLRCPVATILSSTGNLVADLGNCEGYEARLW